jgi:copper transport protein
MPQDLSAAAPSARTAARSARLLLAAVLTAGLVAMGLAPSAFAHAQLLGTSPESGSTVAVQPREVIFKYNQNVGGTLGAVRVYNAKGQEVDNLDVSHPEGHEHWMGVGLQAGLPDGTYTATYRVISADTHIVYGGLVFNIGRAGAAPTVTVAGLISRNKSGKVTEVAFGVVRGLDYLSIALLLGGLAFVIVAWLPGLAAVAGPAREWSLAARMFKGRMSRLLGAAIALGLLVSLLGILLQGASAAGVSLWSSLKGTVLESTLESRFGEVWGLRAIDWLLLAILLSAGTALARRDTRGTSSHDAGAPRADMAALPARPPVWLLLAVGVCAAYLAATPALSGHASIQSPTGVFFPSDVLHVLAASIWVGGVACLLLALPAATRQLAGPERSRLLLATLVRFSPMALTAVVVIAATGVLQAYIDVRSLHALFHSTYGALIIVKISLLLCLICLGWVNRERVIPAFRRIAGAGEPPGANGLLARRTMRGELVLMMIVFGVTAALITYAPPIDAASGPFSTNTTLGPAELEMTVEPAKVGLNTIHIYLINATTGTQFTATKELVARALLPAKGIGPLPLEATPAGPGHYILSSAVLSPGGTWQIQITDRVSEFEQYSRTVKVPIGRATQPTQEQEQYESQKRRSPTSSRSADRPRKRTGPRKPSPEHDSGRRLRHARRASPRGAGRGLRDEGRRAVPRRVHRRRLRKRARLEHAGDRKQARDPDQGRRGNDRHRGLSDRVDVERPPGQGQQQPVHQLPTVAGDP